MESKMLNIVLEIVQQMIEVGGEVYRAEESINRICLAYGAKRVDAYVTTMNIVVSVENEDGSIITLTRRIEKTGTDIERLDKINSLVRWMSNECPELDEVKKRMKQIEECATYPFWVILIFYGVIAGAFCVFFGANSVAEVLVAVLAGVLVGCTAKLFEIISATKTISRFVCSFVACAVAFAFERLGVIHSVDMVIIGNIMALIPGIGLTNALRDLFTGDSITGVLRCIEAVLIALAIACGYVVAAFLFGGV